ncbi:MAG: hemolysin family protein [Saprospiraceae bacterium]|nr:hemolysin family protein [Saprospiraceae bacterium]
MEFVIILLLTLLNGVFSMSEIALVSSRRFKLEMGAKKGHKGAAKALELAESPNTFLSTVQIGITLIGILLGIYSGENITNDVQAWVEQIPALKPYANQLAVVAVLLPVTFLSIVLGELLPKRLGLTFPETIASIVARPMALLSWLVAPFVWLLTTTNDLLLRLFGIQSQGSGLITEEEIKSIINDSTESGEIQEIEQDIVERVFSMGDRKIGALMTHRSDLVWLDVRDDLRTVKQKTAGALFSAYPVAREELDDIMGIVRIRDLFQATDDPSFSLENHLKQPLYVPLTMPAYKVLEAFKKERKHHALVLDEFGSVQGLVTTDDILDALVGDLSADSDDEYQFTQESDGRWTFDGPFPFFEFVHQLELEVDDDNLEFNTLAGFLIHRLEKIPAVGDHLEWEGLRLEVVEMDGRKVKKITVLKN